MQTLVKCTIKHRKDAKTKGIFRSKIWDYTDCSFNHDDERCALSESAFTALGINLHNTDLHGRYDMTERKQDKLTTTIKLESANGQSRKSRKCALNITH